LNRGGVASINAWGENEENPANYDMFNRVKLCILMSGWESPNSTFKSELTSYLYDLSMMTVKYSYVEADVIQIIPTLDVVARKNYSLDQAEVDITEAVEARFVLGETTKIGKDVNYSEIVSSIHRLSGVSYHHLALEIYEEFEDLDSSGLYELTTQVSPIKRNSVKIYAEENDVDTLIGIDNGNGSLTYLKREEDMADETDLTYSDYQISGTVDYNEGTVSLSMDVLGGSPDTIYVRYQQNYADRENDIVVDNDQIAKLREVDIDSITNDASMI